MKNVKLLSLALIAILSLVLQAGCGSASTQAPAAPAAQQKAAGSMPNEDPKPIAQDLERKLQDTAAKVKEGKWSEAKIIVAEAIKTNDRLVVHITDTKLKDALSKSVKEVSEAVSASPADRKSTEAKIDAALNNLKQANVQLQSHSH